MVPPGVFAYCVMVHPEFCFTFFKALLHGPAQTAEPDQSAQRGAHRSITDGEGIRRLGTQRPLDHKPDSAVREALLTQGHPLTGKRIRDRPLGPFCYLPAIPA